MKQERERERGGGGGYANLVDRTGETEPLHAREKRGKCSTAQPFLHALLVVVALLFRGTAAQSPPLAQCYRRGNKLQVQNDRAFASAVGGANKSTPWLTIPSFIDAYFQYVYSGRLLQGYFSRQSQYFVKVFALSSECLLGQLEAALSALLPRELSKQLSIKPCDRREK